MAVRILKTDTAAVNTAINVSCDMIHNIEDLLEHGPRQLEAYMSLLKILKGVKRGCPLEEMINRHATQECPPGVSPGELCEHKTCQSCWKEYVEIFLKKMKEDNS